MYITTKEKKFTCSCFLIQTCEILINVIFFTVFKCLNTKCIIALYMPSPRQDKGVLVWLGSQL